MFMQAASSHMTQYRAQMLDHKSKEAFRYAANESQAYVTSLTSEAINNSEFRDQVDQKGNPIGPFNAAEGAAIAETQRRAASVGVPVNSQQMLELERGVRTAITGGVVNRLMLKDQYQAALDYVVEQKDKKYIDENAAQSLLTSVSANRDRQMAKELGESISLYGTLTTPAGTSNSELPVKGGEYALVTRPGKDGATLPVGASITAQVGTPVVSPSDGIVVSKTSKETVIRMNDGSEVFFEGVDKSQLFEGQRLKRGEQIGSFGIDTPISYRVLRNGEPIDFRNVNDLNPNMNRDAARRPQTEQEALAIAGLIDRREIRDAVKQDISQRWAQDRAMAAQENQRALEAVTRAQLTNPNAIDPALFAALTPAQQSDALGYQRKSNETKVLLEMAIDPKKVNRPYIFENWKNLTPETCIKLLDKVNSGNLIEASVDADMVNATLAAVPKMTLTDEQNLQMRVNIERKIFETQSATGKKLDMAQKQEIIDRAIADTVDMPGWMWGMKVPKPFGAFTPSQLQGIMRTFTPANRAAVIERLQLVKGIRNPTESQIETEWETMGKAGTK